MNLRKSQSNCPHRSTIEKCWLSIKIRDFPYLHNFFWNFLVAFYRFGGLSPFPPYLIGASHNISLWNYSRSWIWVLNYNNHSCLDCKVPKVYCVSCSILNLVEFHGFICRQARSSILEYLSSSTAVWTNFIIIYLSAQVSHGLQFAPEVLYNQVLSKVRNYHRRAPS